jgi:glycine betaine/proline transport system ATP-binding protein
MKMDPITSDDTGSATAPALSCADLWKVFGTTRAGFASAGGPKMTKDDLARRGWTVAMREVSVAVKPGEVFVIMGLSGSGKSTLIRCLTRLVEPTWGAVRIGATDLLSASEKALVDIRRNRMGMVFQHFALLGHRSVLDNIAFPLQAQGIPRAAREGRAREMAEVVGLSGWEHRYPSELSGGQQQRVGIARSLATDPALWFLDEPFSALDPLIRADLQDELVRLQTQLGKTVVFITHDLDEAIRLADRIAIMEGGRIVQTGTPEDLVFDPADDYVRRFVSKVPPAKVMTCARLARRGERGTGLTVAATSTIASVAASLIAHGRDATVTDATGQPIGRLCRDDVVNVLAGNIERVQYDTDGHPTSVTS